MRRTIFEDIEFQAPSGVIPACLITKESAPNARIALVLPGGAYSYRQPLLHFAIQVLLQKNFRVLALDKLYTEDPRVRAMKSPDDVLRLVEADTLAVFHDLGKSSPEPIHTVVARSLGTFALATALENQLTHPHQIVWQSPALFTRWETMNGCGTRSFGILGTADHYHSEALPHLPEDRIVVEGADHGMEIPGKPLESIEVLKQVTSAMADWLED